MKKIECEEQPNRYYELQKNNVSQKAVWNGFLFNWLLKM